VLAKVYSCAVVGLEGVPVEVEVDISQGLPSFQIVGLPDAAVQESKERVRPAVRNSGFSFPMKRLTANLAPADIRKAGPSYDLPIAVGLLLASEQLCGQVERALFVGELGLDGAVRHTDGVLPMVSIAKSHGIDTWPSMSALVDSSPSCTLAGSSTSRQSPIAITQSSKNQARSRCDCASINRCMYIASLSSSAL